MAPKLSSLRPLKVGDVIIEEKALIHVVWDDLKGRYCDNCLTKWTELKKCSKCLQMFYCDKSCQQNDWKYHKNECKVFRQKQFKLKYSSTGERLLIRLLLAIRSDDTFATKRFQIIDGSDVCLNEIVVSSGDLLINRCQMLIFDVIVCHFKCYGLDFDDKQLLRWFAVIHCSHICENLTSFVVKKSVPSHICLNKGIAGPSIQCKPTPVVGIGLFPQLWPLRHSCQPNTNLIPNGLSFALKAIKPIAVGTQITRTYINLAQNKSNRRKELFNRFNIRCNCLKCNQNLDSNINYRNYDDSVDKLKSLLWKLEEDVQQLKTKPNEYDLKEYIPLFNKIKAIQRQVFGEISIEFSQTVMRTLLIARYAAESCGQPWDQTFEQQIEDNIKLVFGVEHPVYKMYSKKGDKLSIFESRRHFRDFMRNKNI